jgi:hypothetical protein
VSKDLLACDQSQRDLEDKLLVWGFGRRYNQLHTSSWRAVDVEMLSKPAQLLVCEGEGLVGRDGVSAEMFGARWRRKEGSDEAMIPHR